MITLAFQVTGRVQGVSFRAWTVRTARALELTGWVRNRSDGTVDGRATGPADALALLEQALHRGPPHAAVTAVHTTRHPPESFQGFHVAPDA